MVPKTFPVPNLTNLTTGKILGETSMNLWPIWPRKSIPSVIFQASGRLRRPYQSANSGRMPRHGDSMARIGRLNGICCIWIQWKKTEIRGIQWILMGVIWSYTYLQHVITNWIWWTGLWQNMGDTGYASNAQAEEYDDQPEDLYKVLGTSDKSKWQCVKTLYPWWTSK